MAVAILAIACGGGGESISPTEDGLRDTVRAYSEAILGDGSRDAYGFFTASCKERLTFGDFASRLLLARGFFKATFDMEMSEATVGTVEVRDFDAATGTANVSARLVAKDDPNLVLSDNSPSFRPWRFELGQWRTADCERFIPESPTPNP